MAHRLFTSNLLFCVGYAQQIARTNTWQVTEKRCHRCQIKNSQLLGASEHVVRQKVKFWLIAEDEKTFAKQNLHLY